MSCDGFEWMDADQVVPRVRRSAERSNDATAEVRAHPLSPPEPQWRMPPVRRRGWWAARLERVAASLPLLQKARGLARLATTHALIAIRDAADHALVRRQLG